MRFKDLAILRDALRAPQDEASTEDRL